ncbi:MAG: exodeoxyribonuclease VII small subunit [Candidatus Scalindua sp.]|nr:exodeoxyribonuclease VII small subunit [Candidatus Scalindua sp.]
MVKKPDFETLLKELEGIVEEIERGDLTLDQTLAKYESGIKIYTQCHKMLENTEKKINIVLKKTSGETCVEEYTLEKTHGGDQNRSESTD